MSTAVRIVIAAFVLALGGYFYLRAVGPVGDTAAGSPGGATTRSTPAAGS